MRLKLIKATPIFITTKGKIVELPPDIVTEVKDREKALFLVRSGYAKTLAPFLEEGNMATPEFLQ